MFERDQEIGATENRIRWSRLGLVMASFEGDRGKHSQGSSTRNAAKGCRSRERVSPT